MKVKGSELQKGMRVKSWDEDGTERIAEVRTTGRAGKGKRLRLGLRTFASIDSDAEYEVIDGINTGTISDAAIREQYLGSFGD